MSPKIPSPRRFVGTVRRRLRDVIRGETAETFFDLDNPRELDPVLLEFGAILNVGAVVSGNRVRRIYELRADLRDVFPIAFTPPGRRAFLAWLLQYGRPEFGVTADECLQFLHEEDVSPDRGLASLYRLHPAWQCAVPDALTSSGWPRFKAYLAVEYELRGRWFRRATLPKTTTEVPRPAKGVNVLAHFRYASGLQEAAFGVVKGLHAAGYATSRRELPVIFPCDWTDRDRYDGLEVFDATIYVAAANTFPHEWYPRAGLHPRPGVRKIAMLYWELDELPAEWHKRLTWADEIWAPTNFIAGAFRKAVTCPVYAVLPGLSLRAFGRKPKSDFGLCDDRFLFLFTFDMMSAMRRKNPLAVIEAYRRAFRPDDRVQCAIKVSRGTSRPENLASLRAAASEAGVRLIDRVMPRENVLALLAAADCYVSAHRAEGLGLGLAESMLLGAPTIATAFSGNLDFMTPEVSYLVDYDLVPVGTDSCPYDPYPPDCHWAAPRIDHLASQMRRAFDSPDESKAVGDAGRRHVERLFAPDAFGRRMADRLNFRAGRFT